MSDTEKTNKKEQVVELTAEEKTRFVEDLVFKGYAVYEKSFFDGKLTVKYKSITGEDQLDVESKLTSLSGSNAKLMHTYSILLLSKSILKINDDDLSSMSDGDKFELISKKSNTLIDLMVSGHNEFHKKLQACTKGEVIDEVFFEVTSTSSE